MQFLSSLKHLGDCEKAWILLFTENVNSYDKVFEDDAQSRLDTQDNESCKKGKKDKIKDRKIAVKLMDTLINKAPALMSKQDNE